MASRKKSQNFFEASALALVVILPLFAIGWYFTGGNDTSDTPSVTTPASTSQAPVVQQSASVPATATIAVDDSSALPSTVTTGQVVPFSFMIENTGTSAATFPYKVYVIWNNGEQDVIDENSVSLAAGASTDISESLKFETATDKGQVYIELQSSGQTIHFTMPRA